MDEADQLVGDYLEPGRWPQAKTVERFLGDGCLERLLSLYSQAMALDPSEAAYPWNLSSVLRRLGQFEMAAAFLKRAIRTGEQQDDADYSGPSAYLALAELSIDVGDSDDALVALARARERGHSRPEIEKQADGLLRELGTARSGNGETPLADLLTPLSG